jgi:hypothetical protein
MAEVIMAAVAEALAVASAAVDDLVVSAAVAMVEVAEDPVVVALTAAAAMEVEAEAVATVADTIKKLLNICSAHGLKLRTVQAKFS